MLLVIEGMAMCLIMLLTCVVGIAKDGPVGLVTFYEKEVQDRVVALGLTTKDKIRKSAIISGIVVFLPMLIFIPAMVYGLVSVFIGMAFELTQGFLQMLAIGMIYGLFDRLFIDWYWVGKTRAWDIPGTEDLKPYIYGKTLIQKWVGTLVMHPLFYALIAWMMSLILK